MSRYIADTEILLSDTFISIIITEALSKFVSNFNPCIKLRALHDKFIPARYSCTCFNNAGLQKNPLLCHETCDVTINQTSGDITTEDNLLPAILAFNAIICCTDYSFY